MDTQMMNDIKSLQTHFGAIWAHENIKLSRDEVNLIGSVYKRLNANKRNLNLACSECVRNALAFIAVWHQENNKEASTTNIKKKKSNGL